MSEEHNNNRIPKHKPIKKLADKQERRKKLLMMKKKALKLKSKVTVA